MAYRDGSDDEGDAMGSGRVNPWLLQVPGDEASRLVTLGQAEELRNMELVGHGGDRNSGLAGTAANGREQRGEHGGKKQELTARPAVVSAGSGTTGKRRIMQRRPPRLGTEMVVVAMLRGSRGLHLRRRGASGHGGPRRQAG